MRPILRPRRPRARAAGPAAALLALLVPAVPGAAGQARPMPSEPVLQEPWLAWEEGRFDEALEGYLRALDVPGGDALVPAVAGLTGERWTTVEVAPDGADVRVSGDGRWAAWRVEVEGRPVTRVADLRRGNAVVSTLPGGDAVFTDGGVAYRWIDPEPGPALAAALEALGAAGDRAAFVAARDARVRAEAAQAEVRLRPLPSGEERVVDLGGRHPAGLRSAPGAPLVVLAYREGDGALAALRVGDGDARELGVEGVVDAVPAPRSGAVAVEVDGPGGPALVLVDEARGLRRRLDGRSAPAFSDDGTVVAFLAGDGAGSRVEALALARAATSPPTVVAEAADADLADPAPSPDGRRIAYARRVDDDWELFVAPADGGEALRLSFEVQHDRYPLWLDGGRVLAMKGEGRHRRAFVYDVDGGPPVRLHHNNTVRTIAPEYGWTVVPGGGSVLVVAERDGDTVSPERGVYRVDLTRPVGRLELRARLRSALEAELALRSRGAAAFALVADEARALTEAVSVPRIAAYAEALYRFGSKHILQPGNARAIREIEARLRGWGYAPELQWFEPRPGVRTANVVVRIPGTVDPDVVYVASSHFDSVERGPGADDDTSGTTALLETARVLRDHPLPATVELAFFTGEEAGLLGSREYVRRAVADGKGIVGALNNDMVGWSDGPRLDNTIRYSNPGIRDVQHAAALQFSDLITYDALYYKSTDAAAYYEAYGDIVGGIGSYPVLGNPHYHQASDRLNTVNQRLVAEVARTTVATLVLLASSPSRLADVRVAPVEGGHEVSWAPAVERTVREYVVRWREPGGAPREARVAAPPAGERPSLQLRGLAPGTRLSVRAVNARGMEGWDGAVAEVAP